MFGVGPQEMVMVALLALIVFGPQRLGVVARDAGLLLRKANGYMDEFRSALDTDPNKIEPHAEEADE